MLIRHRDGWTFRVEGEPDSDLSLDATNVALREVEMRREHVDRALVALSTALGIETLPAEEAVPLLEAHHRGVAELPDSFGGWGAVPLAAAGESGPVKPLPVWWPAPTSYVAQMQAAWFAVLHPGRREHPRLRVLF